MKSIGGNYGLPAMSHQLNMNYYNRLVASIQPEMINMIDHNELKDSGMRAEVFLQNVRKTFSHSLENKGE